MSEERNSFKRLQEQTDLPPGGEKELKSTVSFVHSVSRVIELYLPGFFQLLISMSGGGKEKEKYAAPHNLQSGEKRRDSENSPSEPPL